MTEQPALSWGLQKEVSFFIHSSLQAHKCSLALLQGPSCSPESLPQVSVSVLAWTDVPGSLPMLPAGPQACGTTLQGRRLVVPKTHEETIPGRSLLIIQGSSPGALGMYM